VVAMQAAKRTASEANDVVFMKAPD